MNMMVRSASVVALPTIAQAVPDADAELLDLEEQIFAAYEAATAHDTEIARLNVILGDEAKRLYDECSYLTQDERSDIVFAMPAAKEHDRLVSLADPHHDRMQELIEKMWAIPATTPEGRRAKFLVLLGCIMDSDWRQADEAAHWHIEMARKMIIEFIGGEPAKQLRDQFS
jgi:hypothetical protein